MEYISTDHSGTTSFILASIILFKLSNLFTPEVVNTLTGLAAITVVIINFDKVYDIATKWCLRIKDFFSKFKRK